MGILFWIILMVILLVIEAATYGLATIWFAAGAFASAIFSIFVKDMVWLEWVIFAVVSAITLLLLRPYAVGKLKEMNRRNKTGIDTYIGQTAKVLETINNLEGVGRADYKGQSWAARSKDDSKIIEKDKLVRILEIKGVNLIVEEIKEA
ncbi:MAG: NfeD family protein [Lachnospiraceae bacterium]|nr:NfeD family protein [Lachnospiraceae bacterium]